jgi:peptide/nickel transport system permease protein
MWSELRRDKFAIAGLIVVVAVVIVAAIAPILPLADPFDVSSQVARPPSQGHLLGTDHLGRDMFSRIMWGTRTALLIGLVSAGISAIVGIIVGSLAGFLGGWIDDLIGRTTEVFLVMPIFFLLIVIVSLFGNRLLLVVLAIGAVTWPKNARIMRARVLELKGRTYVTAALGIGASRLRVLFRHVVPNGVAPVLAQSWLLVGAAILTEAGLSFLGLGDPNIISWGQMIRTGQPYIATAWWMSLFPGLAVLVLVSAINFLGDGLTSVLNPRLRRERS